MFEESQSKKVIAFPMPQPTTNSKKFLHSPEIYIIDLIRTRSFISLPEKSYIDIAMTMHIGNETYLLSYSGKLYHYYQNSQTQGLNFLMNQTKICPLNWFVKRVNNQSGGLSQIEVIPFGPATYDYNFLHELIDSYYNNHLAFMKKQNEIDKPSDRPFSQKQRSQLCLM